MAAMDLHGMTPPGELISESQLVTAATLSQVAKVQDLLNALYVAISLSCAEPHGPRLRMLLRLMQNSFLTDSDLLFDSIESESAEMSTLTPTMVSEGLLPAIYRTT